MKKFSSLVILISFLIITISPQASASSLQNFTITRFVQNYNLIKNSDGTSTAKIDEYITADFPVLNQNHGILRALPNSYDGISLKLSDISVDNAQYLQTEPPTSWSYTTYSENNNKVLKIGDPNTFVNGVQYYHISYTMQNVVRDFVDHQELYINVNGTDWEQQFYSVESIITTDNQVAATVQNQVCFTGTLRSTESACEGFQGMQNSTQTVFTTNTTEH